MGRCTGKTGRALVECKKTAGRVKRDSIKTNKRFSNTTNPNVYSRPDNSPAGIARGRKFEKDNDYEGWKSMKKLEKSQNRANNKGRPTQRTSSQKKALTKAWNFTNIYNKKT